MANTPVVYSEHDRHALLMAIAQQVTKQVHENPHPDNTVFDGGHDLKPLTSLGSRK